VADNVELAKPTTMWSVVVQNVTKAKVGDIKDALALISADSLEYQPKQIKMVSLRGQGVELQAPLVQYIQAMEQASCAYSGGFVAYFWEHINKAMTTKEGMIGLKVNHHAYVDFTRIGLSDLPTDLLKVSGTKYLDHLKDLMYRLPKEENEKVRTELTAIEQDQVETMTDHLVDHRY